MSASAGYRSAMATAGAPDEQQILQRRRAWVGRRERERGGSPTWRRGLFRAAGQDSGLPGAAKRARQWRERSISSRLLHRIDATSSHAGSGAVAAAFMLVWLVVGLVYGFPDWWETVLYSVTSAVTLVMVFVIQHTQTRQQSATQRKLDELLRALPSADDRLIAVEEAPDQELEALAELNLADREHSVTAS